MARAGEPEAAPGAAVHPGEQAGDVEPTPAAPDSVVPAAARTAVKPQPAPQPDPRLAWAGADLAGSRAEPLDAALAAPGAGVRESLRRIAEDEPRLLAQQQVERMAKGLVGALGGGHARERDFRGRWQGVMGVLAARARARQAGPARHGLDKWAGDLGTLWQDVRVVNHLIMDEPAGAAPALPSTRARAGARVVATASAEQALSGAPLGPPRLRCDQPPACSSLRPPTAQPERLPPTARRRLRAGAAHAGGAPRPAARAPDAPAEALLGGAAGQARAPTRGFGASAAAKRAAQAASERKRQRKQRAQVPRPAWRAAARPPHQAAGSRHALCKSRVDACTVSAWPLCPVSGPARGPPCCARRGGRAPQPGRRAPACAERRGRRRQAGGDESDGGLAARAPDCAEGPAPGALQQACAAAEPEPGGMLPGLAELLLLEMLPPVRCPNPTLA